MMKNVGHLDETRAQRARFLLLSALLFSTTLGCAKPTQVTRADAKAEPLPAANLQAQPLLQMLQKRHTSREYSTRPLPPQMLSDLLWAAYGVNRPDGRRTAPSAHDWQYIDIYVARSSGLFRFDAKLHSLELIKPGDIRAMTGLQAFAAVAPISLIYVTDERRFGKDLSHEDKLLFGAATTGAIVQNVYLFCAANGLNTGVRADINRQALHDTMGLAPEQHILLAQSAGYSP